MVNAVGILTDTGNVTPLRPVYLENLSVIADNKDGKYTDAQVKEAFNKREARHMEFLRYAIGFGGDGSLQGMKNTTAAYINYINKLSPEEQNSSIYKGTKEAAVGLLAQIEGALTGERANIKKKPEDAEDPLIKLLRTGQKEMLDRLETKTVQATNQTNVTVSDVVTLSEEARKKYLGAIS